LRRVVSCVLVIIVLGQCARGAEAPPLSVAMPAWTDPVGELVFAERFTDVSAAGLRVLAPAGINVHESGVVVGQGPDGCNAYVLDCDLPSGATLSSGMDMPETVPRGLDYRFSLRIETHPSWPDDGRFLELRINHGGAGDSIYAAEPLEHPETRDSVWLERATKEVFLAHAEHVYRGWTRYRGNTANTFLRRYDGRKIGEPLSRLVQLTLRNLTTQPLRVRIAIADISVTRIDIDNLPEMKALLAAPSPFIRQTRAQILLARERVGAGVSMPEALMKNLHQAREFLNSDFAVPRKQAGWPSEVRCETKGCPGRPQPAPPAGYRCPECDKLHSGERYDGLLIYEEHRRNAEAVRCLGFAWQGWDDDRYARKAEEILLAYAGAISEFRLGHNWLGDCWLMEDFIIGYDYIREWAAPATRHAIEQDFLMPMLRRIHHYNHHYPEGYASLLRSCTWCALLAKDKDWIYYLVLSPTGNRQVVIRYGLTDDHVSLKGAAYHGSLMRSIGVIGQSLENCGMQFFDDRLRPLYEAIPRMLFPDNSLPAFGHANVGDRPQDLGVETAYRYYRDPVLLPLTSPDFRENRSARIFWEDPALPPVTPLRQRSTTLPALGLTMLRTRDNSSVLALNWGAPQRNDPSRLDFQFFGAGGQLLWSSGITDYANPLFGRWYQQSVSRNGIVVDEQTQQPRPGALVALAVDGPDQFVAAELADAYPDTRWLRIAVLFDDGAAMLIDRMLSPTPRTVDWVCQLPGDVRPTLHLSPIPTPFEGTHGYDVLSDIAGGDASRPFSIVMQPAAMNSARPRRAVQITPAPQANGLFFLAQGRTGHQAMASPVGIIRRESVSQAVFATLFEPLTRDTPGRSQVRIQESDARSGRIIVQRGGRSREVRFLDKPDTAADHGERLSVSISRN
jgi:hypothetical protein